MGRADIAAAAALHAVLQMELRKPVGLPHPHRPVDKGWVQIHGAGGDAVPAPDAHRLRLIRAAVLLFGQAQQGVGVFHHRGLQIRLDRPGHGPAGEDDGRLLLQAPRRLQQAAQRGPDGHPQVPGPGYGPAAHCDRPVGDGLPLQKGCADHIGGGHIEHGALHIHGRLARGHLPAGDGAHQLFFHPQGIAGLNGDQFHRPALPAQAALQKLHGIELVARHHQHRPVRPQQLREHLDRLEHLVSVLQQQPVVRRQIGFALRGADDQGVHPTHRTGDAQVGGAGAPAHAGDARLTDALQHLGPIHPGPVHGLGQIGTGGVLAVIVDDDGVPPAAPGVGTGLDGPHPAGDAGVDVHAPLLRLGDHLAHGHLVPRFDHRDSPAAGAHGQGDGHLLGGLLQRHDGLAPGALLIGNGVDPA